jgi:hypothetical protein
MEGLFRPDHPHKEMAARGLTPAAIRLHRNRFNSGF